MAPVCTILRGLPGSGKSRIAARNSHAVVCSADAHFTAPDGTYNFDPAELCAAHAACKHAFEQALDADSSYIVVDNTHVQVWEFCEYTQLARRAGYYVLVHELFCSTLEDVLRCAQRNTHNVPVSTVFRMYERWESLGRPAVYDEHVRWKVTF